jgi:ADP-ribosylation factor-like protein 4
MELMRTAKCPDNMGVPVLILANKQDLPGAKEPKELEKLLGLHELFPVYPSISQQITTAPCISNINTGSVSSTSSQQSEGPQQSQFKGWFIQPACAITGEGLQEGIEALYEMIIRKRKLNKQHKRKR